MRNLLMLVFGLIIVGLLNFGAVQKERVVTNGDHIYLELRPVDPRSLLQGDYMRLAFEAEGSAQSAIKDANLRSGNIVVEVDENRIGKYSRLDDGANLANNAYAVHFTNVSWQPNLVPNSFFFQEGEAGAFAEAEYAVLVFGADRRDYVMVGLADGNRDLINPRKTLGLELPSFLQ